MQSRTKIAFERFNNRITSLRNNPVVDLNPVISEFADVIKDLSEIIEWELENPKLEINAMNMTTNLLGGTE